MENGIFDSSAPIELAHKPRGNHALLTSYVKKMKNGPFIPDTVVPWISRIYADSFPQQIKAYEDENQQLYASFNKIQMNRSWRR